MGTCPGRNGKTMKKGINRDNLDMSVSPREDFYTYATGGWQEANPLTAEYSRYGVFNKLAEAARENVRDLITNLSATEESKQKGSIAQKISDLYSMGMDMERRDAEGAAPMKPVLDKIEGHKRSELFSMLGWLAQGIDSTFYSIGVGPDPSDSDINMLHIGEAGLGLGDRDYYLENNETYARYMEAYRHYIKDMMVLAGYSDTDAQRICDTVIRVETEFAKHKKTKEERRDPTTRYNPLSFEELAEKYPAIGWKEMFAAAGLAEVKRVNLSSPKYLEFINSYLPTLSDREIKDMMVYGFVSESTGLLSQEFYDVSFELFGKVMSGTEEQQPLWKRAMSIPNSMFGEAVGQLYVQKYFPEENKKYMLGLVENLREALGHHIDSLTWMSDATKQKGLEKLKAFKVKIGYPDKWKDYSEIEINPERSYLDNVLDAARWFALDNFKKMDQPVDKDEWFMTPQTVNAYYNPTSNEICFPAGILQPPFFDITADDAQNYGAIGVVIGHEMTHGFDDSGRKFDLNGNLANWWTKEDEERFKALTDKLVKQFDEVEVAPGVHANGRYTLGENIADQGGLRVSLTAYLRHRDAESEKTIDGFTPLQRFYLAYAGVWASNIRPEEILVCTQSDPHSLAVNRVNVTLKNIDEFIEAFDIKEGDNMYRPADERVIIW